jgi:hypothetical protein
VKLEIPLILVHHAVEPWEQLLGAVVSVEDDRNAIDGRNGPNVVGTGDGAGNRGFLVAIGNALGSASVSASRIGSFKALKSTSYAPFRRSRRHHLGTSGG